MCLITQLFILSNNNRVMAQIIQFLWNFVMFVYKLEKDRWGGSKMSANGIINNIEKCFSILNQMKLFEFGELKIYNSTWKN